MPIKHLQAIGRPPRGTGEQLAGAIRALELILKDDALKQIDAIWPGPGGEAPMAYAW